MKRTANWRRGWAAIAAAVWAGVFAVISLYWALGGRIGIDTVGGEIEKLARSGSGGALAWGAALLKVVGVVYALALVQRWGRVFPRPLMLAGGWLGTAVLIVYGGVNVGTELLVATGVLNPPAGIEWYPFYWHLALWDPYFLVWGILLGIAVRRYQADTRYQAGPRRGEASACPRTRDRAHSGKTHCCREPVSLGEPSGRHGP